jgi:hypothetical protein
MQDEPNQTDLYRSALGGYVARSDDGTKMRGLRPSEQPPPGWHLLTKAELEAEVDLIVEELVEQEDLPEQ